MSTGAIVAIVIGALILIALLVLMARRGRERKMENMRVEAQEHRSQARVRARTADREQAEADEAAARAKKARAVAEEQAAQARRAETEAEAKEDHAHHERTQAEQLHGRATEIDPDAGEGEESGRSNGKRRLFRRGSDEERSTESSEASGNTDQVPAEQERSR